VRQLDHGRRPGRLLAAIGVGAVAVAVGVGVVVASGGGGDDTAATTSIPATAPPATAPVTTVPSIDVPGSIWWVVNPQRSMPAGYVPADLVTPNVPIKPGATNTQVSAAPAAAFEAMVADAATAGFQLQLNSGYRSFDEQQALYDQYVEDFGAEVAAERVAIPGTSEHQTGLAVDVGEVGLPDDQVFGDTQSSVWVADNAHRFGFILRYPPDKAAITGYANEPWHLRYVGPELAAELHASGLTMEEHFGLAPAGTPSTQA
jgi:D-alanyl-D-alanine carboxypeptidase